MRYRLAQIVVLVAACVVGAKLSAGQLPRTPISPQTCPASSEADDQYTVSVSGITFLGAFQMPISDQNKIATSVKEKTHGYSIDDVRNEAVERVRTGWQDNGYFKVKVSGAAIGLNNDSAKQRIGLTFQVDEGSQYRLGGIRFKHNRAIADVTSLRRIFPIKDGDILSREKVGKGLENLRKAYTQFGYINFTVIPNTRFDEANKLISLDMDIDEGQQFYVSRIEVLGLDEATGDELLKSLPMKGGQIYNSRLWELSLLQSAPYFRDSPCHQNELQWDHSVDEKSGSVVLRLDFRSCSN